MKGGFQSLPPLRTSDQLGREIFSQGRVAKIRKHGRVPFDVFQEKLGVSSISVNRLNHASDTLLAEIGDRNGQLRDPPKRLLGWAVVTVSSASQGGREVIASPRPLNPFHGEIALPTTALGDRNIARSHAMDVAAEASYRPRFL